jgi:hypothetical protein
MPDWREHLDPHLARLRLSPGREADIIEELSQHLDQRYEELRAAGVAEGEARRLGSGSCGCSRSSAVFSTGKTMRPVPLAGDPESRVLAAAVQRRTECDRSITEHRWQDV